MLILGQRYNQLLSNRASNAKDCSASVWFVGGNALFLLDFWDQEVELSDSVWRPLNSEDIENVSIGKKILFSIE